MRILISICLYLFVATNAAAQDFNIDGWEKTVTPAGMTTFQSPDQQSAIMIKAPEKSDIEPEIYTRELAKNMTAKMPICKDLGSKIDAVAGQAAFESKSQIGGVFCRLIVLKNKGGILSLLYFSQSNPEQGNAAIDRYLTKFTQPTSSNTIQANALNGPTPEISEAALKKAAMEIPVSNKPVKIVSKGNATTVGWPPAYVYQVTAYNLFKNGLASSCSSWDPGSGPIPNVKGPFNDGNCDLIPWRQNKDNIEFQSSDGTWSGYEIADGVYGFKPGERIDVSFGNISGMGFNLGGMSTSTISSSDLRMTADGNIATGSWSTTNISGSNVAGGTSRESGALIGRYYLDGNIIVIQDRNGQIHRGFIGGVGGPNGKKLDHIHLNGTLYSSDDD
jgi:hypothetical protein